jgi:hypothetical protein
MMKKTEQAKKNNGTALATRPTPIDPLLKRISEWVSDRDVVDPETRETLEVVAQSNTSKMNLFRQVMGMKKVQRLVKLHGLIEGVEDKLFSEDMLSKIKDPKLLLMMTNQLRELIKEDSSYIDRLVAPGAGLDPAVQSLLHSMQTQEGDGTEVEEIKEIEPQKRESIRKVFAKIARQAQQRNGTN